MAGAAMRETFLVLWRAALWFLSLGGKFFRVAPALTSMAVFFTILSQLLLLVGFLLPLKVVLLLGSDNVPRYFPDFMLAFSKERLVILLSVTSVLFYFGHLASDALAGRLSKRGAEKLVQRNRKMIMFERQDEISSKGYLRFSQAFAGICFVAVCLLGMLFFYLKLALVIVGYFFSFSLLTLVSIRVSSSLRRSLSDGLGSLPKLMGGLGFLIAFAFIVVDYLYLAPVGILVAVISLILSRQLFGKSSGVLKDVAELFLQRDILRPLYFHSQVFSPAKKHSGFSEIVERKAREKWMLNILTTATDLQAERLASRWVSLGAPDLLCFLADIVTKDGASRQILFKVFDSRRRSQAIHEATLLSQQQGLGSPPLLGVGSVEGMNCHVFNVTHFKIAIPDVNKPWQVMVDDFRARMFALTPTPSLVSSCLRSQAHLARRLKAMSTDHLLHLYEGQCDLAALSEFTSCLPVIADYIDAQPLAFYFPDIRPNMLWFDAEENLCLIHFGRWELEPVGFRWPQEESEIETLLALLKQRRSALGAIDVHYARLVALCSNYEDQIRRGRYDKAFGGVPAILAEFSKCKSGQV